VLNTFAVPQPSENLLLLVLKFWGNNDRYGLAYSFLSRVAEDALRALIPSGDNAI
jgi:hypothetical protein